MKRLLAAALSAAICITASSALAVGAVGTKLVAGIATEEKVTADQSGVCGKNATWTLSGDKLSIGGTGPMASWAMNTDTPWYKYRDAVRSVEIAEGITTIGPGAFADFPNLYIAFIHRSAGQYRYCRQRCLQRVFCAEFYLNTQQRLQYSRRQHDHLQQ